MEKEKKMKKFIFLICFLVCFFSNTGFTSDLPFFLERTQKPTLTWYYLEFATTTPQTHRNIIYATGTGYLDWFHLTIMGTTTDLNSLYYVFLDIIVDDRWTSPHIFSATLDTILYFYANLPNVGTEWRTAWYGEYPWEGVSYEMLNFSSEQNIPFQKSIFIRIYNSSTWFPIGSSGWFGITLFK